MKNTDQNKILKNSTDGKLPAIRLKAFGKLWFCLAGFLAAINPLMSGNPGSSRNTMAGKNPATDGFIENKGQIHDQDGLHRPDVFFTGNDGELNYHFRKNGISYQLNRVDSWKDLEKPGVLPDGSEAKKIPHNITLYRLDMNWRNCNPDARIITEGESEDFDNYYLESCADGVLNVKHHAAVTYQNIYRGIDLKWYKKNGHLKYDYLVEAGVDYKQIQLEVDGAKKISIDASGAIIMETPLGIITEEAPLVFQDNRQLAAKWKIEKNTLMFDIEGIDPRRAFIIDPVVRVWATYYGGSGGETGVYCSVDAQGNIFLLGDATNAPVNTIATSGAYQVTVTGPYSDVYMVKFNSTGTRLWGTYYGGSDMESSGYCINDAAGNIFLTGYTQSQNVMASMGCHQSVYGGGLDAFFAKFDQNGARIWSTYYGAAANDFGLCISLDPQGDVYLCGSSATPNASVIATPGSHQPVYGGGNQDGFIARFTSTGVRVWGTYYGGTNNDIIYSSATDAAGNIYVGGNAAAYTGTFSTSQSTVIATPGSHQPFGAGSYQAFLAKFNSSGVRQWSTYYGGQGTTWGAAVGLDATGNIYLTGYCDAACTLSISTPGSHQPTFGGGSTDLFLAKFNSAGLRQWATYYGGTGGELCYINHNCAVDAAGNIIISGDSNTGTGTAVATPCNHQPAYGGGNWDGFLAKFNTNGVRQWGSYYGGAYTDGGVAIIDGNGNIFMAGSSASGTGTVIATAGSHQPSFGGTTSNTGDAYLVKFIEGSATAPSAGPISGPVSLCPAGSGTYSIATVPGATSYSWSLPGGWNGTSTTTAISATAGTSGMFSVSVLDACGAGTPQTLSVTVNAFPSLTITASSKTICAGKTVTLAATGASTYTWNNGTVSANMTVSPTTTSNYTVTGISTAGCANAAVTTINVQKCTGIDESGFTENDILVYPNPFSQKVTVSFPISITSQIEVLNALGSLVYQSAASSGIQIDLSDQPAGMYFIKLKGITKKVIRE